VKGFAENQEDGSVKVVCEGEEEGINELINSIKENTPSFASIEEMNVAYEEYKGEFTSFERRGADVPKEDKEDAMLRYMQSFDKEGEVMIDILSSMNETLKSVKEDTGQIKQDTSQIKRDTSNMLVKQDMMLEKQDDTIEAIDRSKEEIVTEISSLREDLRSYMENKFAKIEHEIEGIKAKIGMV